MSNTSPEERDKLSNTELAHTLSKNVRHKNIRAALKLYEEHTPNGSEISDILKFEKVSLEFGLRRFVRNIGKKILSLVFEVFKIEGEVCKKRLVSFIREKGLHLFLEECGDDLLEKFFLVFNFEVEEERSHVLEQIEDEIILGGVEDFLTSLPREHLEEWCSDFEIRFSNEKKNEEIIDLIMSSMFELEPLEEWLLREKEEKKKRSRKDSKEKGTPSKRQKRSSKDSHKKTRGPYVCPPLSNIKKGMSKADLHNLYNLTDLQQWCKDHNIDTSGKKSIVIHRIFVFLETGEQPPKKKKKPKKSY